MQSIYIAHSHELTDGKQLKLKTMQELAEFSSHAVVKKLHSHAFHEKKGWTRILIHHRQLSNKLHD